MIRNNCYWFVDNWLKNQDGDSFKDIWDLDLDTIDFKGKITTSCLIENIADEIREILSYRSDIDKWSVIEFLDADKRSQHVAFLDDFTNFFDQDGPDGQIRLWENLEDLLFQFQDIFGNYYYHVYSLNDQQEKNISAFISSLHSF